MVASLSLLVVDDEPLYCEACRRVFSAQGFQVDQSNDAARGLNMAQENDYSVVLLDVKMPTMDGIEFLERLREKKPAMPVILMTGFPSIPNAASAVRLRASDYVTKPFTPEEITKAVHHLIGVDRPATAPESRSSAAWRPASPELWFRGESWIQAGVDGTIRAGAALRRSKTDSVTEVRLPRIGEVVFQGLPLLALSVRGPAGEASLESIPSPVSGVVVAVNPAAADPQALSRTPLDEAWAVCLAPTRREDEMKWCRTRQVLLLNRDPASAAKQEACLRGLGCLVRVTRDWNELAPLLPASQDVLLTIDETSLGDEGPELVSRVKAEAPDVKILVVASRGSDSETDYRQRKIFYYAVEPFADNEITEILHAAFCPELRTTPQRHVPKTPSKPIQAIRATNRHGHCLHLLAPDGLLETGIGLGASLGQAATELRIPIEIYLGKNPVTPADIIKAAAAADRVFVLMAKDMGRIPGCLVRSAKGEYDWASGKASEKVSALTIQPDADGTIASLTPATIAALAARIMDEMMSA